MNRSLRSLPALLLAAGLMVAASPASALLHIINFSDPTVQGTFEVDVTGLMPGAQVSCGFSSCDFTSINITFPGGEFTLDDLPGEVFNGTIGDEGFVESLFVLIDDNAGSASGAALFMNDDPMTFEINPTGTYTISIVPEPATAGLVACAFAGALALRRRR